MIEYIDGTFSDALTLPEALQKFIDEVPTGQVQSLHVGSISKLERLKTEKIDSAEINARLNDMEDKISELLAKNKTSLHIPTTSEVEEIIQQHIKK